MCPLKQWEKYYFKTLQKNNKKTTTRPKLISGPNQCWLSNNRLHVTIPHITLPRRLKVTWHFLQLTLSYTTWLNLRCSETKQREKWQLYKKKQEPKYRKNKHELTQYQKYEVEIILNRCHDDCTASRTAVSCQMILPRPYTGLYSRPKVKTAWYNVFDWLA